MQQHFLYFESHKKSLKQLYIIVCFSLLSNAFMNLDEISRKQWYRCMYKQWFKNKFKHKQRAHYISEDLRISRYHFCRRKSITIARKIYLRFIFTFARITCYLEYIWFTHNIFCILQQTDDAIWIIRLFGQPLKWKQKI
jgi:hypothetical protein